MVGSFPRSIKTMISLDYLYVFLVHFCWSSICYAQMDGRDLSDNSLSGGLPLVDVLPCNQMSALFSMFYSNIPLVHNSYRIRQLAKNDLGGTLSLVGVQDNLFSAMYFREHL